MNFVKVQCHYFCGIDLHSTSMTICIMNIEGKILLRKKIPNNFTTFLRLIEPYRSSVAVALESTFNWYWLVDLCRQHAIDVHLGHAFYMKAIHADKKKNDNLDSEKIANLLRCGMLPRAHACHVHTRDVRDLLRHRHRLVYMRSELLGHTKLTFFQHGYCDIPSNALKNKKTRFSSLQTFNKKSAHAISNASMNIVCALDKEITQIEKQLISNTAKHKSYESELLQSVPGIGPIIAMTILLEIDTLHRFKRRQDFASYCRLVRPAHSSNGKCVGYANSKCGNPFLKWAFMEILSNAAVQCPEIRTMYNQLKKIHKPLKARAILANKFCTAVYYMLKHKQRFHIHQFCNHNQEACSQTPEAGCATVLNAVT
jgi:transposase